MDETADTITGDNNIGLCQTNKPQKMGEDWLKNETGSLSDCDEKSFLNHDVPQDRKGRNSSRKCTKNLIRCQNHKCKVVDRNWICFSPS